MKFIKKNFLLPIILLSLGAFLSSCSSKISDPLPSESNSFSSESVLKHKAYSKMISKDNILQIKNSLSIPSNSKIRISRNPITVYSAEKSDVGMFLNINYFIYQIFYSKNTSKVENAFVKLPVEKNNIANMQTSSTSKEFSLLEDKPSNYDLILRKSTNSFYLWKVNKIEFLQGDSNPQVNQKSFDSLEDYLLYESNSSI